MTNRVAIYVRVSTQNQVEKGYSLEDQTDKMVTYSISQGWLIHNVYTDAGKSGGNLDRPAMDELIKDGQKGYFDTVLIYDQDRLSRDLKDSLILLDDLFKKYNIKLRSLSEEYDLDSDSGILQYSIKASIAQYEKATIRRRLMAGKRKRIESGKTSAWIVPPFGYHLENSELQVDDIQSPILKRIFDDYLAGMSTNSIVRELNDAGHIGKNKKWSLPTVKQVLKNKTYAGFTRYSKEWFKGNHEPLITLETYEKVQKELEIRQAEAYKKNNNPRPFQSKYLPSGLLYCGHCGARFIMTASTRNKDGSQRIYYKCLNTQSETFRRRHAEEKFADIVCIQKNLKREPIEQAIFDWVENIQINPDDIKELRDNHSEKSDKEELENLEKEFEKNNSRLGRLVDLYLDGDLSKDVYDTKKRTLESQSSTLTKNIEILKARIYSPNIEKFKQTILSLDKPFSQLDPITQKEKAGLLIDKIIVTDKSISIKGRF
ncbi:recombinase family protein [Lactococcus protaetiae]|uniref:Recombinase family protein n=1 Tax=Lactococcus protaetiae TaxID=2592653 RepID=A0A514Z6U7_9LACT|nr:recombinase family protein [Lactococcus protaetiae]QDK70318.1 recombinase family protein [Lactococcus protaetiae]